MNFNLLGQTLLVLLATNLLAQAHACPADVVKSEQNWRAECRCGQTLANTRLTLPEQLRLIAACGLRTQDGGVSVPLSKQINMDKYDNQGNWLNGTLYFRGRLRVSGVLRYEPSDGGDLFLQPDHPLPMSGPLEPYFRSFVLVPKGKLSDFSVGPSLKRLLCAEARATVEFDGLTVEVAHGAESEGAYPIGARAVSVGRFSKCSAR